MMLMYHAASSTVGVSEREREVSRAARVHAELQPQRVGAHA